MKEHIESFNYFITKGMENIVKANDRIVALEDPSVWLRHEAAFQLFYICSHCFLYVFPVLSYMCSIVFFDAGTLEYVSACPRYVQTLAL